MVSAVDTPNLKETTQVRITLCGSTRFKTAFIEANRRLSSLGHIVYSVAFYGNSGEEVTPTEKLLLDAIHMGKIENSDAIYVVNPGGYIGESTEREIYFAGVMGKQLCSLITDDRWEEVIARVVNNDDLHNSSDFIRTAVVSAHEDDPGPSLTDRDRAVAGLPLAEDVRKASPFEEGAIAAERGARRKKDNPYGKGDTKRDSWQDGFDSVD